MFSRPCRSTTGAFGVTTVSINIDDIVEILNLKTEGSISIF